MQNTTTSTKDRIDAEFHQEILSNISDLTIQLEKMVDIMENEEGTKGETNASAKKETHNQITANFKTTHEGLQTFLTGVLLEKSKLEEETHELEVRGQGLQLERDELISKSHDLHCRMQFNALERKLEETFSDTEPYTSVDGAQCFKEEAEENLRRLKETIRIGNLRSCQMDTGILNQMERMMDLFKSYECERETYVKELNLFDDVRRKRIYHWLIESRTEEEIEKGESIIEFLDFSGRKRSLEPKIIGNILRMHSFNESLAFDRLDNVKRMDEMMVLQREADAKSGITSIPLRAATAKTDLVGQDEGREKEQAPCHHHHHHHGDDDDAYSHFLDGRDSHAHAGHVLHRCPRKFHLATDPVTDPALQAQLEAALRWETNDGPNPSTTTNEQVSLDTSSEVRDLPSTPVCFSGPSLQEEVEGANNSLCGDVGGQLLDKGLDNDTATADPSGQSMPRECLPLHQIESATVCAAQPGSESAGSQQLMTGLVKRRYSGGPSSTTAIAAEKDGRPSAHKIMADDDRETRSQGSDAHGRAGSSGGSSGCSGNPRSSQHYVLPGFGKGRGKD